MTGRQPHGWDSSRRAERRGGSGWEEAEAAKRIMRLHNGVCHVCGLVGADEVDHVIPLCEGGLDEDHNKRPIHRTPCHVRKTAQEAGRAKGRKYSRRREPEPHPGLIHKPGGDEQ